MKTSVIAASTLLLAGVGAFAGPVAKRDNNVAPTEMQLLQFAANLEQLESAFYQQGLQRFTEQDFMQAGFPSWVRGRIAEAAEHEANHVLFLNNQLGVANAVAPCTYTFPVRNPSDFVQFAAVLENIGVAAYNGAIQLLTNAQDILAGVSIITTEARHNAWINSAALKGTPWSGAFDTALDGNQVVTLINPFISNCPVGSPVSPFTANPQLRIFGAVQPQRTVTLQYTGSAAGQYLAFFTGLQVLYAPITNNQVTIPAGLQGTVYAVVTTSSSAITDGNTVAGPAIMEFPFPAAAPNPN